MLQYFQESIPPVMKELPFRVPNYQEMPTVIQNQTPVIRQRKRTPDQIANDDFAIILMRNVGYDNRRIGQYLQLAEGTIRVAVSRINREKKRIPHRGKPQKTPQESIKYLRIVGLKNPQIAELLHVSPMTVERHVKILLKNVEIEPQRKPNSLPRQPISHTINAYEREHSRKSKRAV